MAAEPFERLGLALAIGFLIGLERGWRTARQADGARLDLEWRETGGPPVSPPTKKGFGTRLIQRSLAPDLGGQVELAFDPAGLICRLTCLVKEAPDPSSLTGSLSTTPQM